MVIMDRGSSGSLSLVARTTSGMLLRLGGCACGGIIVGECTGHAMERIGETLQNLGSSDFESAAYSGLLAIGYAGFSVLYAKDVKRR